MFRLLRALVGFAILAGIAGWFLTVPDRLEEAEIAGLTGDPVAGEQVFYAAGCASCHSAQDARGDDKLVLSGGRSFPSDFGTFIAPNISSDPVFGIGSWSDLELATAIVKGTSPDGRHYFPVFPYTAYAKAELQDIVDLISYIRTLPADATPSQPHDVSLPFSIRRGVGAWKLLYARDDWVLTNPPNAEIERGRYLVEALVHCAECHTPRTPLGGLIGERWFEGAPVPGSAKENFPPINSASLEWSAVDIAYYLETGFTPTFDSAGGQMVDVIENMARLTPQDRDAIAAYVKSIP